MTKFSVTFFLTTTGYHAGLYQPLTLDVDFWPISVALNDFQLSSVSPQLHHGHKLCQILKLFYLGQNIV